MRRIFVSLMFLIYANIAFAYITNDIPNGCIVYSGGMRPVFEINEYTCGAGYYLPANDIECAPCRAGYTCGGGTYTFNPTHEQGIELIMYNLVPPDGIAGCDKMYANMYPRFKINEYTCGAGYYLPANGIECAVCPADSYCPGGTYTFNENDTQGIVACANGLYAPTGMWESAQCGRILHIGEYVLYTRTTRKTEHALYVDTNSDGVADYYANATIADVPIHAGTDKRLKIKYDNTTYSIYDDTVVVPE